MVGAVGLNLACANIMVISVSPFFLMLILLIFIILVQPCRIPSGLHLMTNSCVVGYIDFLNRSRSTSTAWLPEVPLTSSLTISRLTKECSTKPLLVLMTMPVSIYISLFILFVLFSAHTHTTVAFFNGKSNDQDLVTSAPVSSDRSDSEPEGHSAAAPETRPSGTIQNPPCSPSRTSRKRAAETSPIPSQHSQSKPRKSRQAKGVTPAPVDEKGKGKEKANLPPSLAPSTLMTSLPHSSIIIATTPHLSSTPASPIPTLSPVPPLYSSSLCSTSSLLDGPEPNWNTDNDPLLAVMGSDPTWQMDPDQLDQLAELELREAGPSSSMSSPPPSSLPQKFSPITSPLPLSKSLPLQQRGLVIMTPGVRPRQSKQDDDRTLATAGSSNSPLPPLEEIGGTPLIPGRMGRFKSVSRNRGGGKTRRGQKIK